MTNEMQMIEVVFDGGCSMYIGLLPWLSMLIVPIIALRSLFLLANRRSGKARRTARRCFLGLHLQSAFCLVSAAWLSLSAWFSVARHLEHGAVFFAMQNVNMSHMLWAVASQCLIATIGALVVVACSGCRPRLWQPRYTWVSILLCGCAQALSFGLFGIIRN